MRLVVDPRKTWSSKPVVEDVIVDRAKTVFEAQAKIASAIRI